MNARSHADRGQLFGYDGENMWIEQTLEEPPHWFICKLCGAESPSGIGYVSYVRPPLVSDADCPNPHLICTLPADTVTVTK